VGVLFTKRRVVSCSVHLISSHLISSHFPPNKKAPATLDPTGKDLGTSTAAELCFCSGGNVLMQTRAVVVRPLTSHPKDAGTDRYASIGRHTLCFTTMDQKLAVILAFA
ncbi:unnamed protein product, partial [Ectocarpus fasciculatus]